MQTSPSILASCPHPNASSFSGTFSFFEKLRGATVHPPWSSLDINQADARQAGWRDVHFSRGRLAGAV